MKQINRLLEEAGLNRSDFDSAYIKALSLYEREGIQIENSERIRLCAAVAYRAGASICDLGSYINIYPVIWALLGMKVTTVDYYPQRDPKHRYHKPELDKALAIYRSVGINAIESDLYDFPFDRQYDVISSFETFEHLINSPKPIMTKAVDALKTSGEFVLSVPNIARLVQRIKAVLGASVLPAYSAFYEYGNPFTGHRREMTRKEVDWMLRRAGLTKSRLFTANAMPPLPASTLAGKFHRLLENGVPIPCLKSQIFAVYTKR